MEMHGQDAASRLLLPNGQFADPDLAESGGRRPSRLLRARASAEQGHPFEGRILIAEIGGVRLCRIAAQAHAEERSHPLCRYADTPFYKVIFQLSGTAHLDQDDRRTVLRAGDWSIYDASRPYMMRNLSDLDQLALLLPKIERHQALAQLTRLIPDGAFPAIGLAGILKNALGAAMAECDMIDAQVEDSLAETLYDLARLAVSERVVGRQRAAVVDTLRARIEAFVLRNLRDQELSVETIAQRMKCSKRYLHKVFRQSSHTLNEFIWTSRLARCERDLVNPALADRSITEIAFSWGFVNSAHFSRSFKARFGAAPRTYRQIGGRLS